MIEPLDALKDKMVMVAKILQHQGVIDGYGHITARLSNNRILSTPHMPPGKVAVRDLIILDAFSSDAVPVHLLTREAIAGYFERLAPGGVLLFHISNRYMDLAVVVANAAAANGLVMRVGETHPDAAGGAEYRLGALVAAVARNATDLGRIAVDGGIWRTEAPDPAMRTWTDDYSNVLGAILRGRPGVGR